MGSEMCIRDSTGCSTEAHHTVSDLSTTPTIGTLSPINICDDDLDGDANNGLAVFDLTVRDADVIGTNVGSLTVAYFTTLADANSNTNPIASPAAYTNVTRVQEIFVRLSSGLFCNAVASFMIEVNELPAVINHPISVLECVGTSTTLSVVATGGTLTYQWQSSATSGVGFTDIAGETNTTYDAPTNTVGTTYYQVIVSDASGICGDVISAEAEVTVAEGLSINVQPQSVTECVGTTTTLSVTASGGLTGITYQWQSSPTSGGVFTDIAGETGASYDAPTDTVGTIYYQVVVSDAGSPCGDVTSDEASVTVTEPPTITTHPISVLECVGTSTTLSVVATGGVDGLTYQWQSSTTSGGVFTDIAGATNTTYDAPTNAGGTTYYQVIVSDTGTNCDSVTSVEAEVTVAEGLSINVQPQSVTECIGTITTLSVTASGGLTGITYQWQSSPTSGGVFTDIAGETGASYDANTNTVGTLYYQVIVSDAGSPCGDVTSTEASVTVNELPVVQPAELEACDLDTDDANASFDGITNFDLTAAEEALITADSGTVTFEFFESQNDIDTNTPIANPTTYRNTTPFNQTLLVVVTNTNGCSSVAELRLEVFETISSQDVTFVHYTCCLLYTSPSPRDLSTSRMPSSA